MARLNAVGFETRSLINAGGEVAGSSNATLSSTTVRTGTRALSCAGAQYASIGKTTAGTLNPVAINVSGTVYYKLHMYITARATTNTLFAISKTVDSTATTDAIVSVDVVVSGPSWYVRAVGATNSSNSAALALNTWYSVTVKCVTNGTCEISINNATAITCTGRNFTQNYLVLGNSVSSTSTVIFDDIVIDDAAMPPSTAGVNILLPTGAGGNNTYWANSPTGNTYAQINELASATTNAGDGDTTYLMESGYGGGDIYKRDFTFENCSDKSITGTINLVKLMAIVKTESASAGNIAIISTSDGVAANGTAWTAGGTTYGCLTEIKTQTNNSTAWTKALVDSMIVGIKNNSTNNGRCTALYAMVEYYGQDYTSSLSGSTPNTTTGTLVNQAQKTLAGSTPSTISGTIAKIAQKALIGSSSTAHTITKLVSKAVAGSPALSGAVVTAASLFRSLDGAITTSGDLIKTTLKAFEGAISGLGDLLRQFGDLYEVVLSGAMSMTGAIVTNLTRAISLAGSFTGSGTIAKSIYVSLAGSFSSTADLFKRIPFRLSGSFTGSGSIAKVIEKTLSGSVTSFSGSIVRLISKTLSGSTGSISHVIAEIKFKEKILDGAITASGVLTTAIYKLRKFMKGGFTTRAIMKAGTTIFTKTKGGRVE